MVVDGGLLQLGGLDILTDDVHHVLPLPLLSRYGATPHPPVRLCQPLQVSLKVGQVMRQRRCGLQGNLAYP